LFALAPVEEEAAEGSPEGAVVVAVKEVADFVGNDVLWMMRLS